MEEAVKELGFENLTEFNRLVSEVDLSTPSKILAFKEWRSKDGSKKGLMELLKL